jgi:hypothetical protein
MKMLFTCKNTPGCLVKRFTDAPFTALKIRPGRYGFLVLMKKDIGDDDGCNDAGRFRQ